MNTPPVDYLELAAKEEYFDACLTLATRVRQQAHVRRRPEWSVRQGLQEKYRSELRESRARLFKDLH